MLCLLEMRPILPRPYNRGDVKMRPALDTNSLEGEVSLVSRTHKHVALLMLAEIAIDAS